MKDVLYNISFTLIIKLLNSTWNNLAKKVKIQTSSKITKVLSTLLPLCINSDILPIDKIEVSLNAVGKAPKLKVNKFKIKKAHTFQHLISFVRK